MAKLYPIGIQNFEKIRIDNYLYLDKTALIYQLVKTGSYYFLSRPRRFGKSLLISTLEAYFQGKKELFQGLAIENLEKDWIEYPVLHLDLNARKYDNEEALLQELNKYLEKWEQKYDSPYSDRAPEERFYWIIPHNATYLPSIDISFKLFKSLNTLIFPNLVTPVRRAKRI